MEVPGLTKLAKFIILAISSKVEEKKKKKKKELRNVIKYENEGYL